MYKSSLDSFFEKGENLYYRVSNADGKVWYISNKDIKTSLQLYQPSSFKGKTFKLIFPVVKSFSFLHKYLGVTAHYYKISPSFLNLMCSLFKVDEIDISVFEGTPSVHQKTTLQISWQKHIFGYCKLSEKEEIKTIFKHEQQVLDTLNQNGIKQIPACIYRGILKGNMDLFVQTTTKTNSSEIVHGMNKHHWDFLTHLSIQTKQQTPFGDTDFNNMLERLSSQLEHLSEKDVVVVSFALAQVREHFENNLVSFSVYHGDFTPWNMFVQKNELFVFDWEYAQLTYPPYLDYFHFFTQQAIYTMHWNADKILEEYLKHKSQLVIYFTNPDFSYLCYLLDIIERYINREKGILQPDTENNIYIWVSLVSNIMSLQKL